MEVDVRWKQAIMDGDVAAVRALMRDGRALGVHVDGSKSTPLDAAVAADRVEVCVLLLEAGAVATAIHPVFGATPLHVAASTSGAMTELLLDVAKVDPNIRDRDGYTPLHYAARAGNAAAVSALLERGADPKLRGDDGDSPLHKAAAGRHFGVSGLLLDAGADVDIFNQRGLTPMHNAVNEGHLELCRLFEARHPGISGMCAGKNLTPMQCAIQNGKEEVVELLALECGADLFQTPANGGKLLSLARGDEEMKALIRSLRVELRVRAAAGVGAPGANDAPKSRSGPVL
jgi:hypothetical protein